MTSRPSAARVRGVHDGEVAEPRRTRTIRRTASWLPILALLAVFAADHFDAAHGVMNALLVVAVIALAVNVIFLLRDRDA